MEILKRFIREEDGAAAAEYAIILAVISAIAYGAFQLLGTNITARVNSAATQIGGGS